MDNSFLPLGSIVLLKDATTKILIIGYIVKEKNNDNIWDYLGAPYPLGVIEPYKNLLFNRNQIDKVIFKGYEDEESSNIINYLNSGEYKKNGK